MTIKLIKNEPPEGRGNTSYWVTVDDEFLANTLVYDQELAESYYTAVVENGGTLDKRTVLEEQTIQ